MRVRAAAPACAVLILLTGGCVTEPDRFDPEPQANDLEVTQMVDSLNDYWSRTAPEIGLTYRPIKASRVMSGPAAVCDGQGVLREDVEENAYVDSECSEGLLVVYDAAYIGASLARLEGTFAHEWGHVVQAQNPSVDPSTSEDGLPIDSELQADCFSGAWAADEATASINDLRADVRESGDTPDVAVDDDDAHGTPNERLAAFELGYDDGAAACIDDLGTPSR